MENNKFNPFFPSNFSLIGKSQNSLRLNTGSLELYKEITNPIKNGNCVSRIYIRVGQARTEQEIIPPLKKLNKNC